jgi:hypothetical protein
MLSNMGIDACCIMLLCWFCLQDGIIAAKRIDMSKKGVETCGDVDEVSSQDQPEVAM